MTAEASVTSGNGTAQVDTYRCIDGGHSFDQWRSVRTPLAVRQTAWCVEHASCAVLLSDGDAPTPRRR